MNQKKSIYLIDGSSYIYRAFYAIGVGRLSNAQGMPTQAIYGFAQMLLKVVRERKPDYICVVFDSPGPTKRHELYDQYKATRLKTPEDLIVQAPYISKFVKYAGIPQIEMQGYEADDLIATLARRAEKRDIEVVIVSGDKDLCQLIEDPKIVQWDPQKDRIFDEAGVLERFGVTPAQMTDYLSLTGDSSDNIPGVKGVGEKTARRIIEEWGSLDTVFEHVDEVTPESLRKKLMEGRDSAYLSRRLILLDEDAPIDAQPEDFAPAPPLKTQLAELCEELGFKSLLEALRKDWGVGAEARPAVTSPVPGREDRIVTTSEELVELVRDLEKQSRFSIHVEMTPEDPMRGKLVGVAVSREGDRPCYLPVGHSSPDGGAQISEAEILRLLGPLLERPEIEKIGHDLKNCLVAFKRYGVEVRGAAFDAMVAGYLLDPGRQGHGMDRICAEYLGEAIESREDVTGRGRSRAGFDEVPVARAARYACSIAESCLRVEPELKKRLVASGLMHLYRSVELPLIEVLAEMESLGILVDADRLESLSRYFEKALDRTTAKIYELAKEEFNILSPKQLAYILFEKLGLRTVKKTKSGPSTDVGVLEELIFDHPIIEHILSHRGLAKLKGTYADSLFKLINPRTGRIHTSFNQTVTATGRLSSSDPNLQNIPIRSEEGRKIREAFISAPGHLLMSADYSQIELRILAHYSGDERLVEAFKEGADVHGRTAAELFGVPLHEVGPEMRRQAKTVNFGIIYGMGAFGLARRLRIGNKTAKETIERYFERYRGVKGFIDGVVNRAREFGYSETILGRRRAIPELQSRNHNIRQLGERLAVNTPVQGTAADLIKKAMIDVDAELKRRDMRTKMILQVHDELVFETPADELEIARKLVAEVMENVWELAVPLKVDIGWAFNWADAHP